jgi:hypothetical protein
MDELNLQLRQMIGDLISKNMQLELDLAKAKADLAKLQPATDDHLSGP